MISGLEVSSAQQIIHQITVDLSRSCNESGTSELAWQANLMDQFPDLLAGSTNKRTE